MSDKHLLESADNGVVTLTMNRPESLNALSPSMMAALTETVPRLATDAECKVVVLTGAGRGFCAGGDVKGMASRADATGPAPSMEERAHGLREGMEVSRILHEMPKPTIAMMRGPAAGAGLSLALACDMRIVSESARFTTAFAKVGFSGDYGSSYFLPQLVGAAKAKELFFTADVIEADEALRLGIVNRIVADDQLESETRAFADQLAGGPTVAYRYIKKNLNAALAGSSIGDVFDLEAWNMTRTGQTDDHKEAAKAFVEKRKPTFSGR
ncbi:MAG: enoyl-CoA hydratase [Acidobacteriota bacterium]|nr:enoyl-CoA hydratase [Acidobacteriota bacterium]